MLTSSTTLISTLTRMGLFAASILAAAQAWSATADAPFEVAGLHTDLSFAAAVEVAEKLGATCAVTTTLTQRSAHCEVPSCAEAGALQACAGAAPDAQAVTIAGQPVLRISLDTIDTLARGPATAASGSSGAVSPRSAAADPTLPLARISFLYGGDTEALAVWLQSQYGPSLNPTPEPGAGSWSHARRRNWERAHYRLGLMDRPPLLVLSFDLGQRDARRPAQPAQPSTR